MPFAHTIANQKLWYQHRVGTKIIHRTNKEVVMTRLRGTNTERNLLKSFAGESQASNRYDLFAGVARKEGYVQVANVFTETASQEREHAKRFFRFLEGGDLEVTATFPAGVVGTTAENLLAAATGEQEEHAELYPAFAEEALREGFNDVAAVWRAVSVAEKHHEERYRALLDNVQNNRVFDREEEHTWECSNCGYLYTGTSALERCPACAHSRAYFQLLTESW